MLTPAFLPCACPLLFAVCLTASQSRASELNFAGANAEQIIHHLHESRTRLQLLELRYKTTVVHYEAVPTLAGCTCEYNAWFDFLDGRIRVDGNQHCPDHSEASANSRFAYANQRLLLVDDDSLAGREEHGKSISYIHDLASGAAFRLCTDPRLVGMLPGQLSILKNYSTDDIIAILQQSASQEVTDEVRESESMKKLVVSGYIVPHCTLTLWLSPKHNYMPIRILCTAETKTGPLTSEAETEWTSFMDVADPGRVFWLPNESTTRQWDDGKLIIHETFTLSEAIIGRRPDDAIFEWASMKLRDGFVVIKKEMKSKSTIQWDSDAQVFGEWKPKILNTQPSNGSGPLVANAARSWSPGRSWMVIGSILTGFGLVVYCIFGRRSV